MRVVVLCLGQRAAACADALNRRAAEAGETALRFEGVAALPADLAALHRQSVIVLLTETPPPAGTPIDAFALWGDFSAAAPATAELPSLVVPREIPPERLFPSILSLARIARHLRSYSLNDEELNELHAVGAALLAERDLDRLLQMILEKSRKILSADAGSIFLVEGPTPEEPTDLRFKLAQNDSVAVNFEEFVLPINRRSLAGYVATTRQTIRFDDVYLIPPDMPFGFNREIDQKTGYRSKSVLSVSMEDHRGRLIGVVQLWNKKRRRDLPLNPSSVDVDVIPFTESDQRVLASLSAQAGIAVENARLYEEINHLFESFIRASVQAIESRDPTTSGHSERVAILTVALAQRVDRLDSGPYRSVHFTQEELRELRYAALLHDFGKIGVRERVLIKAKKLFSGEFELIRTRFALWIEAIEAATLRAKLELLGAGGTAGDARWRAIEGEARRKIDEASAALEVIERSNEPTVLPEAISKGLFQIRDLRVTPTNGDPIPLVTEEQLARLAIPKGSLSEAERLEVESHVTQTYRYLEQIPWTADLRRIPEIAYAHHEKLNGSGYPRKVDAKGIPTQSKIMTVTDIFDALAARDRPYKKAVPVLKALEILEMEVRDGQLDPELVRLFIEGKVYELTSGG